eukprot:PITA_34654
MTIRALFALQDLWEFVEDGFEEPADENEFNNLTQAEKDRLKSYKKKDSKALLFLYQAVHESVFPRITAAKTSREAWKTLKIAYQGMKKVKIAKLQLLRREFENLCMKESDNIDSLFTHVIGLVTQIRSHGEILEERSIVEKLLRVLPSKFDVIVSTIEETNDLTNFSVDELHASLITHEQRLSRNENSSLEHAFKTQMSFGRGRGQGRGNKRGRGRYQNTGGRNSSANTQGRCSNPNQNQGQGSNQQSGQHHAQRQNEESKAYRLYNPSTKKFFVSRDVQFIEEEAWDGSIEKTVNVKSSLLHDEDDEETTEIHLQTAVPTQGQQETPLRRNESASPSTSQGGNSSASLSTCTPNKRGKKFRNLSDIYDQEVANEGMNSLFALYCHVDDLIHFEDAIKDRKWIEAMDDEINAIERNKT